MQSPGLSTGVIRLPGTKIQRLITRSSWAYAVTLAAATALLWATGDRWWFGTILCFGPRWVLLVPLPFAAILAFGHWRTRLLPLILAMFVAPFWLDYSFGFSTSTTVSPNACRFRVVTFNAQGDHVDATAFAAWATGQDLDVMFFQESDLERLKVAFDSEWNWRAGDGGVVVASRHRVLEFDSLPRHGHWELGGCMHADLEVEGKLVRVGCVHLPTPREGLQALVHLSRQFLDEMSRERERRRAISAETSQYLVQRLGADVIAGDFNMPIESRIFRDYWCETTDAFSAAGSGLGHTKFTRWHGVRIDHVLIGNRGISVLNSHVGPNFGSDHRPVFAELLLPINRNPPPPSRK